MGRGLTCARELTSLGRAGPRGHVACVWVCADPACVHVCRHQRVCPPTSAHWRSCVGGRERIKVLPACFRHARLPLSSDILRGGECGSDHRLQGQDWGPGFCGKLVSLGEGWNFQRSRWEWVPVDSQQGHGAEAGTGHEACGADAGDAFSAVGHAEGTAGESPILVSRTMRNRPPSLGFPYGSPS